LCKSLEESFILVPLAVSAYWSEQLVLAGEAACPLNRYIDTLALSLDGHHDRLYQVAQYGLAVGRRRLGCAPQRWDIGRQT
jgi:hypothetical protein